MHNQKSSDIASILKATHYPTFYEKHISGFNANGKKQVLCHCQFHKDNKSSFSVNMETGLFYCHACGEKGNAIHFLQRKYGIDFKEALQRLKDGEGIADTTPPLKAAKKVPAASPKKPSFLTVDQIGTLHRQLTKNEKVLKLFMSKYGLSLPTIEKYLIGYQNERFVIPIEIESGKWTFKEHKGSQLKGSQVSLYPSAVIEKGFPYIVIAEGEFKTLLLLQHGFPAASGTGGANTWKKEWNARFAGLDVIIAYDNDEPGRQGAQRVAESLSGTAKSVKAVQWPAMLDGSKDRKDVTDYFITLGKTKADFQRLIENAQDVIREIKEIDSKFSSHSYFIDDEGYSCRMKSTGSGSIPVRLANFSACIDQEIIEDDGLDQKRIYQVSGKTRNEKTLPNLEVNAGSFNSMNWPHHWGTQAILEPGESVKDYLRHFIQVSSHPKITTSYSHTGWREINGEWVYLSSSGAIGKPHVTTKLPRELQRYSLPLVPEKEKEAIEASLEFLIFSKPSVTFPLFAITYLSPLTTVIDPQPNFSGFLYGETGSRKTTIAVLMLSHFGNFTSTHALSNFESTANLLMRRAFTLKDVLMVIDDYHPTIQEKEAQQKESILQRIIRSSSNRTDRARLNADSTEKGSYEPRGMILLTGEDLPTLQSTLARSLVVEILKEDISLNKLTELQRKAHLLPYAMSSYIHFLRNNFLKIQSLFSETFTKLREKALSENMHGKLSEQIAFLYFTLEVVTAWAIEKGIIDNQRSVEIKAQGWQVFKGLANFQQRRFERENPVRTFIEVLDTLINQGKVYLEHKENYIDVPILGHMKGDFIGCFDDNHLYIMPPALWNAIQRFCRMEGTHFPVTKNTLYRLLKISGLIETKGEKNTVTGWIKGKPTKVLKFYRTSIDKFKGNEGNE